MTILNLDTPKLKDIKTEEVIIDLADNMPKHYLLYGKLSENNTPKVEKEKEDDIKVESENNNIVEVDLQINKLLEKKQSTGLEKNTSDTSTVKRINKNWLIEICMKILPANQFTWLKRHRLLKAKALLIDSNLSIEEIAQKVGYKNTTQLSIAYKKEFNLSPYQQKNLTEIEVT